MKQVTSSWSLFIQASKYLWIRFRQETPPPSHFLSCVRVIHHTRTRYFICRKLRSSSEGYQIIINCLGYIVTQYNIRWKFNSVFSRASRFCKRSVTGKLLPAKQHSVFTYDTAIATLWSKLSCLWQGWEKCSYWYRIWGVDSRILLSIYWFDLLFVIQCDDYDDDTVVIVEWCLLGLDSAGESSSRICLCIISLSSWPQN